MLIPNSCLVMDHEIVREKLDILRRVLDFIPFSLLPRSKVPVAISPPTDVAEEPKILRELFRGGYAKIAIPLSDSVHDKAHTYNSGTVH